MVVVVVVLLLLLLLHSPVSSIIFIVSNYLYFADLACLARQFGHTPSVMAVGCRWKRAALVTGSLRRI